MTVADDGVESDVRRRSDADAQQAGSDTDRRGAADARADDAPLSVVVEAGVITVTGGPIAALLLTTELTGMPESAPMFNRLGR